MMGECQVCVSAFTTKVRRPITCPHCQYRACSNCVKRVLLGSMNLDPACMQCNKSWTRQFLFDNLPKTFLDVTLRRHRENLLLEREKALLPATQPVVEREMEIERLEARIAELRMMGSDEALMKKEKRQFVQHCPAEGCKGFLSTAWKCGICENWTCPHCHALKGKEKNAEHTCKPEDVDTVRMLAKDTKNCPKCAVPIHRIQGCSQMFCTQCHTIFDWNTMVIGTDGPTHNPHYFEMRQRMGQNWQPANLCNPDLMPNLERVLRSVTQAGLKPDAIGPKGFMLMEYARWLFEVHDVRRHVFAVGLTNNLDLRVRYMTNQLTEERFKQKVYQREKAMTMNREVNQVLSSLHTLSAGIYQQIANATTQETIMGHVEELQVLHQLAQDGLDDIQRRVATIPERIYRNIRPPKHNFYKNAS